MSQLNIVILTHARTIKQRLDRPLAPLVSRKGSVGPGDIRTASTQIVIPQTSTFAVIDSHAHDDGLDSKDVFAIAATTGVPSGKVSPDERNAQSNSSTQNLAAVLTWPDPERKVCSHDLSFADFLDGKFGGIQ